MDDALPMIVLRWALYGDLMMLFGVPLFALHALPEVHRAGRVGRSYSRLIAFGAIAGLVLSVAALAWSAKGMVGAAAWSDIPISTYAVLVVNTTMGWAWQVRMVALLALLFMGHALRRPARPMWTIASVASAASLASLAWTGHGAMDAAARGMTHLAADIVHLWAAGAWWGALVAFVLLARDARRGHPQSIDLLSEAAHGFTRVGAWIVALLMLTGVINYVMIAGVSWETLASTRYGHLLVIKLWLFGMMLVLASMNRYRLVPALAIARQQGEPSRALRLLQRSVLVETGLAGMILGLVAWLGTLSSVT
ncbi:MULTISPECIES: copper homeostasis membrane protein CopD [unclassified Luteibacter]|uniref:copper homeostasis membrane protein CopD n=1 Tax=Luteibacter sp. PvP019 TaxID=3156436 RepID=UPI003395C9ED